MHQLFYRYKIPVILFILIAGIFDFRLVLYTLPPGIIQLGLITGGATALYLVFNVIAPANAKILFIKELWIAVIYTIAVWGGPVIYGGNHAEIWQIMVMAGYGLLVLANVLSYSYFEFDKDMADQEHTFAVDFGTSATRIVMYGLIVLSLAFMIISGILYGRPGPVKQIVMVLMSGGMLFLISFPERFKDSDLYGIFADALFLLPFLVLVAD